MADQRQKVFLKLKTPCVNLSTVALKFRVGEAPVKDVLKALEEVKKVLDEVGSLGLLDPKLSEYAFFPLAQQVFNETRRLSPRCLEVAAECVTTLVKYGYRQLLLPELGKQLLILMSMLASAGPTREEETVSDELKIAAFGCILAVLEALKSSAGGTTILEDQGTKNVVDQLVYLILDAITNSVSDQVQLSASKILTVLVTAIESRVFLASLLPRTVSALTKALKPSTQARRTQKVLAANLKALRVILSRVLPDQCALNPTAQEEKEILDKSWFNTTTGQVKNALYQVVRLRNQESASVRNELEQLCVMVIETCHTTLVDSIPAMLETLVVLSAQENGERAHMTTQHLITAYPDVAELLRNGFYDMYQSLPGVMQSHDEQVKKNALQRITASLKLLPSQNLVFDIGQSDFIPILINSVSEAIRVTPNVPVEVSDSLSSFNSMEVSVGHKSLTFQPFILNREGQRATHEQLQTLLTHLSQTSTQPMIVQRLIDVVADSDGPLRLTAAWLAMKLLPTNESSSLNTDDWISVPGEDDSLQTKSSLIADLYASTLPLLANVFEEDSDDQYLWQMQALAMECVVIYARTFPADSYRLELINSLYPVLSFLGSPNSVLRSHSVIALNNLAQVCEYTSAKDLLIDNVDYLVNSIAWKLNTYSLSPEAPQILQMMIKLCGAQLIPYLDDLIQSIFVALDSYHGYPQWVEALFSTLKAMVSEGTRQPQLAIRENKPPKNHKNITVTSSIKEDILDDLRSRKRRKLDFNRAGDEPPSKAPHRPWTNELDGPTFPKPQGSEDLTIEDESDQNNEYLAPSKRKSTEDEEKKLSRPHELLISIAKSTLPHLASPSPQVRHLLLDLLKDISPLLSRDETSFLPLINAIWPVLVPRLFAEHTSTNTQYFGSVDPISISEETAYNICAAADTIAVLCEGAGDFMVSRIEDISVQLIRLIKSTQSQIHVSTADNESSADLYHTSTRDTVGQNITGPVNLAIVKPDLLSHAGGESTALTPTVKSAGDITTNNAGSTRPLVTRRRQELRTSQRQILHALLNLLAVILSHVRLTIDTGDELMNMLMPYIDDVDVNIRVKIREVVEGYNADAVWLFELKRKKKLMKTEHGERGIEKDGLPHSLVVKGKVVEVIEDTDAGASVGVDEFGIEVPKLRRELLDLGLQLKPVSV